MDSSLLEKARRIEFPYSDGRSFAYRNPEEGTVRLPFEGDCRYAKWKANSHHYTTKYHREVVLPTLDVIFRFGYDTNDFALERKIVSIGNDTFDLSHMVPVGKTGFRITHLVDGKTYEGGFDVLMGDPNEIVWFDKPTAYHALYRYPHSFSHVENLDGGNGRSLLVLGDSQMIPSIPILCCYYGKVTYVDNRYGANASARVACDFDDVLIAAYKKPFDYYIGFL